MSPQTPVPKSNSMTKPPRVLPQQPAEQFWQRYSPHHEFSLSSLSSIAVHLGIIGVVIAGAFWLGQARATDRIPLPFGTVQIGDSPDGESGTEKTAKGEQVESRLPPGLFGERPDKPLPTLPKEPMPPLEIHVQSEIDIQSYLEQNEKARQKIKSMQPLERGHLDGLANKPGVKDGTAQEGKKGTKGGPEKGDPDAKGKAINEQIKRQLRWFMNFNTFDSNDYLKQLEDLGAKLAFPVKGENQKYLLINDLAKSGKTKIVDDLGLPGLIWWTDVNSRSIEGLVRTLKIREVPDKVIAFFPHELEDRLVKMELAYAEKNGHKSVDDIDETKFQVKRVKSKYQPVVLDQRYKQAR
jgi:hypothetical protein